MPTLAEYTQGSAEWLALRKTKVTATDAAIIMGANPWKTPNDLFYEKLSEETENVVNANMQRGIDFEPLARELFNLKTGLNMQPEVIVKEWMMASLDGRDPDIGCILEIKCPSTKVHAIALSGSVPDYYYPQLQHQMYLAETYIVYYFSFWNGDGPILKVKRDDAYIEKMLIAEKKFYDCLMNKTLPEQYENEK